MTELLFNNSFQCQKFLSITRSVFNLRLYSVQPTLTFNIQQHTINETGTNINYE